MQDHRQHGSERLTVGVLAGWQVYHGILHSFLAPLFQGIRSAARDRGCNLLFACGMSQAGDDETDHRYRPAWPIPSPESDFVPVGPWNTDGLIIISPLITKGRARQVRDFLAAGHPTVFVGASEGRPALTIDNEGGIRQALQHLAEHGHRRIAFVAGPEQDTGDSACRLNAYHAGVQELSLESDDDLIVRGLHTAPGGQQAIRQLLDTGASFSAVLASNDESAIGAMQTLREAGLRIPKDVAVVGFDDRIEAGVEMPPLTTVRYPQFEIGHRALELLLQRIATPAESTEVITIETQLIIRRSCGCRPVATATRPQVGAGFAPARPAPAHQVAEAMVKAVSNQVRHLNRDQVRALCERCVKTFVLSLEQHDAEFLPALEQVVQTIELADEDVQAWQGAISVLANHPPVPGENQDALVQSLLCQAQTIINQSAQRQYTRRLIRYNDVESQITQMNAQLLSASDGGEILDALAQYLPRVGIERADVIFFEPEENDPLAWSRLPTKAETRGFPSRFRSRDFPPEGLYPADESFGLALLPLIVGGVPEGFVAFDSADMALYGAIVQHLSAAFGAIQLRQEAVEASNVRDRLLSTLSHELHSPLNLIADLSELLLKEQEDVESTSSEKQRQDLARILASAKRLDSLIQDVLDLAWSEIGQLELAREPLDLGEVLHVVASVGRQMAQDKGLGWQARIPPELPQVYGDRTRLRQVVLNLISNAIKSTSRGEVALEVATLEDIVSIAVRDTGPGVPREDQQALFNEPSWLEPTGAQAYEEMGLSLAVCKRLVEMHGGEISVWSFGQEGTGSTFFFTLPVMAIPGMAITDASPSQVAEVAPPEQAALPQKEPSTTILVVDGEPGFLEMHARVVQAQRPACRVLRAQDGQQALKTLREELPSLLLLNLATPELDGFGLIKTMQQGPFTRDIPIVVMTEQSLMEQDIARLSRRVVTLLERGVFNVEETLAHIEAALAQERGLSAETQHLVWKAMAYIHRHYADSISRTDVAQHIGVSEDYLSHCFSEGAGIPFITYINRYRLKQAMSMLAVGEQSVTEVAMETGFQSASHFSRLFRREVGVSPNAYRRGKRAG